MQETENYIWYTHSSFLLGKGATGKVFKVFFSLLMLISV